MSQSETTKILDKEKFWRPGDLKDTFRHLNTSLESPKMLNGHSFCSSRQCSMFQKEVHFLTFRHWWNSLATCIYKKERLLLLYISQRGRGQLAQEIKINSSQCLIENMSMFLIARLWYKKPAEHSTPIIQKNCSSRDKIRPLESQIWSDTKRHWKGIAIPENWTIADFPRLHKESEIEWEFRLRKSGHQLHRQCNILSSNPNGCLVSAS